MKDTDFRQYFPFIEVCSVQKPFGFNDINSIDPRYLLNVQFEGYENEEIVVDLKIRLNFLANIEAIKEETIILKSNILNNLFGDFFKECSYTDKLHYDIMKSKIIDNVNVFSYKIFLSHEDKKEIILEGRINQNSKVFEA